MAAARLNAACLRTFALIVLISVASSAPQQKQNAQKQAAVVSGAGGGAAAAGGQTRVQDPKCLLPKEPGPCRMNLDRYYYNSQTNNCELFKFGGCRGNDNKFGFLKTCEDACKIAKPTANNTPAAAGAAGSTNAKAPAASAGAIPRAPAPPAAVGPKVSAPVAVVNPKAAAVAPNATTKKTPVAARA